MGNHVSGRLWVETGGGVSKEFGRVSDEWRMRVIFSEGEGRAKVTRYAGKHACVFVVGIDSDQGKQLISLLKTVQPWAWKGVQGEYIANEVYFGGEIMGMTWDLKRLYPDEELKAFLRQARRCLQQR